MFIFGSNRRQGLKHYRNSLETTRENDWIGGAPGLLPWWRIGRPPRKGEVGVIQLDMTRPRIAMDGLSTGPVRQSVSLDEFLKFIGSSLGCTVKELSSTSIETRIVEARETIALLAVERYGYSVKGVAAALRKHPETASRWIGRALKRKDADSEFRVRLDKLDQDVAGMTVRDGARGSGE